MFGNWNISASLFSFAGQINLWNIDHLETTLFYWYFDNFEMLVVSIIAIKI